MPGKSPSKSLSHLLGDLMPDEAISGDVTLAGLCDDSRLVTQGDLFCALNGEHHDAKEYVADATAKGAAAVLCEPPTLEGEQPVPVIAIDNLRERLGIIASRFYGEPSLGIDVIAVTGTNGKTSFTQMLAQSLAEIGDACGMIGTLGYGRPGLLTD